MIRPDGLAGRHALVTGASHGIGRALALALAAAGVRTTLVARRRAELERAAQAAEALSGLGHAAIALDLTEPGGAAQAASRAHDQAGPIDIVVHCAGGSLGLRDLAAPSQDWARIWQLNVGHAIDLNNAVIDGMRDRGYGRILHFSSRAAVELGGAPAYSAAKAYLNAYITMMGRAHAQSGVLINGIMPSAIAADGNNWFKAQTDKPDGVADFLRQHQAIGRLGTPDDLIPFALLLCSSENRFAAGSVLSIDGGST